MPDRHYHNDEIVNVETKHETSDVNVKALLSFVVVFIIFAIVTHIVLYLMFRYYKGMFRGQAANAPLTAIQRPAGSDVPAEPRLQPFRTDKNMPPTENTPVIDMETMRRNEDQALNNAAWIDKAQGKVRLPIDVAKQLFVQRGGQTIVSGQQTAQPGQTGLSVPHQAPNP